MKSNIENKYSVLKKFSIKLPSLQLVQLGLCFTLIFLTAGCIYKFSEKGAISADVKTVKLNMLENRAEYINHKISQRLTDRLRQKIVSQTRLSQTNSDSADWDISGAITQYSISTSAISNQRVATNRLTVAVHMILNDRTTDKVNEYDVSRSFEFSGTKTRQQAEAEIMEEMTRTLTDEIFNKLFSDW